MYFLAGNPFKGKNY